MSNTRFITTAALILALAVVLIGCSATPSAPTAEALHPISIQMAWVHEYSSAQLVAAKENGRFAEQGLDVTLITGGFGAEGYIESIGEVLAGNGDFGLASGPALLEARAAGQPVVALMTVLQRSPDSLITLADSNITRPEDLVGKTVAVQAGGAEAVYNSLLISQGIDAADVNTIERQDFGVDPLTNGEVDAIYGWLINEGVQVEEAGHESNVILLSDYGVDTYPFVVFTTEEKIANEPEIVRGVVKAMIAGMEDVISNPSAAIDQVLAYDETLDRDQQLRRLEAMIPLMHPAGSNLGMMSPEIWDLTYQILSDEGVLTTPVDVSEAYTMDFLNEVYGEQ